MTRVYGAGIQFAVDQRTVSVSADHHIGSYDMFPTHLDGKVISACSGVTRTDFRFHPCRRSCRWHRVFNSQASKCRRRENQVDVSERQVGTEQDIHSMSARRNESDTITANEFGLIRNKFVDPTPDPDSIITCTLPLRRRHRSYRGERPPCQPTDAGCPAAPVPEPYRNRLDRLRVSQPESVPDDECPHRSKLREWSM